MSDDPCLRQASSSPPGHEIRPWGEGAIDRLMYYANFFSCAVTPWMVSPQKRSPRTEYRSHTCPPAEDGPTLGKVSAEAEKWARKDEAVYAS